MTVKIINADCEDGLLGMAAGSVHMCCTSPPYWGLRSYLPDSVVLKPGAPKFVLDEIAALGIKPIDRTSE